MVDTFCPSSTLSDHTLPRGASSSAALSRSGESKHGNHMSRDYTASQVWQPDGGLQEWVQPDGFSVIFFSKHSEEINRMKDRGKFVIVFVYLDTYT